MKGLRLLACGIASLAAGLAQAYVLIFCFSYFVAYNPLVPWLLHHGVRGWAFRSVVGAADLTVSVILSVPAALFLAWLRPSKGWLYLMLAVLPSFGLLNHGFLLNPPTGQTIWQLIAYFWPQQLLALPIAFAVVRFVAGRAAPNKSFKPNPLRGSA